MEPEESGEEPPEEDADDYTEPEEVRSPKLGALGQADTPHARMPDAGCQWLLVIVHSTAAAAAAAAAAATERRWQVQAAGRAGPAAQQLLHECSAATHLKGLSCIPSLLRVLCQRQRHSTHTGSSRRPLYW